MRSKTAFVLHAAVALLFCAFPAFADDPPGWLIEASKSSVPQYDIKNVPAVVLKNDETITVNPDGAVLRTTRFAVRVLVREGREEAVARVVYQTDSEKVRDLSAWLLRRSGPMKAYGKKEAVDISLAENDLYNEARIRIIDGSDDADTGDVFGFESVSEERTIFSQFQFQFQTDLPVIHSRFNLNLPAGWRAESVTFNHAKVEPVISGNAYTWELRGLPPISHEAGSPSRSSLSPRLAVSFFPGQAAAGHIKTFANWGDVARWMSEIEDPQMTIDDALAAKARDLTVGAKTEFEKIQAISRYVQQLQYISIQVGAGRGGGYKPRTSTEVFAKSYGDCKDKANLMRAMLSVLKISAFMVSITSDDRTFVRAEWASPHQFNHCIIAIRVGDETKAHTVITHPTLGRLLIFDPTDPYTPIGDLPEEQQGSLALIDHKDTTSLTEMPVLPPELNRLERSVEISLNPVGDIAGSLNEKTIGQSAVQERAKLRGLSAPQYNQMVENWIARGVTGVKATNIKTVDNHAEGNFNLDVEFNANAYAQIMQGRLMVFKPAVIGRLERLRFTEGARMLPFMIEGTTYSESVKIKLPQGFEVDELPEPAKLESGFGKYSADYKVQGDSLLFTRSLTLNRTTVPASKYDTVKNFFGRIHAAEQAPVVLIKK